MSILEKLNFKLSRGSMRPDSPSVLAHSSLDPAFAELTLTASTGPANGQNITLLILITQKQFLVFH